MVDFICQMQKLGKIVGMTGDMLHYAILNGLKPHIAGYVTQTAPLLLMVYFLRHEWLS